MHIHLPYTYINTLTHMHIFTQRFVDIFSFALGRIEPRAMYMPGEEVFYLELHPTVVYRYFKPVSMCLQHQVIIPCFQFVMLDLFADGCK